MTPNEKAKDLIVKITESDINGLCGEYYPEVVKQCALICVDEILELDVKWLSKDIQQDYPKRYKPNQTYEFWEEVKQEIEKL